MTTCRHRVCAALADDECHVDAEGWVHGITREQHRTVIRRLLDVPLDDVGRQIDEMSDGGLDILRAMERVVANPKAGERNHKLARATIERCRLFGIPRDGWRAH